MPGHMEIRMAVMRCNLCAGVDVFGWIEDQADLNFRGLALLDNFERNHAHATKHHSQDELHLQGNSKQTDHVKA